MLVLTLPETNKTILSIRLFPSSVFFFPSTSQRDLHISPFIGRISKPPYASTLLSKAQSGRSRFWPQLCEIPPPFTVANAPSLMHDPSLEMSTGSVDPSGSDCQLKSCTDCQTTTTPLWRAGPSGPPRLMHDPSLQMSTGSVDPSGSDCQLKSCTDCQTTTTPLWRAGPSGPKSLCNACGIRFRKNRRMTPASKKEMITSRSSGPLSGDRLQMSLKVQMLGLGLWEHRSVIQKKRRRSSLVGEEEQAAFLLMALSSGFV